MKKLSFIPLLIFLFVNIQCGGGGDRTHSGTTPVIIKITEITTGTGSGADQLSGAIKTNDLASAVADEAGSGRQLSLCRFTMTGAGMSDMVRDVDVTGKTSISETFNIPSGTNRKILIQMFVEHDNKAVFQASREGIILKDIPVELEMKLEATAEYFQPPAFGGVLGVSNAESRSVKLSWKPAADNISPHERIQYLIFLSTESIAGRDDIAGEFINTYSMGKGSVLEGDALMNYEYDGDELLLISYEYEGALPEGNDVTPQLDQGSGRLEPGMPYYFIVKAKDEWGHLEGNYRETEEVVVYMLDVAIEGSGTVTSEPEGINCGEKCSEDYLRGTEVILRAEADEGGAFESWTGKEECGGAEECTVIPDEDTPIIMATFCQTTRYYSDIDGDGYGDDASYMDSCTEPDQDNYVEIGGDCDDSNWVINPSAKEFCGNDVDENCDGTAEKDCDCNEGDTRSCGTDTGECVSGVESCVNREWSGFCDDERGPSEETCDGKDNDCDGETDEDLNRPTTCGVGECAGNTGTETCTNGVWGNDTCDDLAGAGAEICEGTLDENCDGTVDDGCECTNRTTQSCGTDTGECVSGTELCINGKWNGVCDGEVGKTDEVCDGKDNDCDGDVDETFSNLGNSCSKGKGECKAAGIRVCNSNGTGTTCNAVPKNPMTELCDGKDNDCDGETDEDLSRPTTCGLGECAGNTGTETCINSKWGNDTCDPLAGATDEICDNKDNDCNPSTQDGSGESWYNMDCDGNDTDNCKEGKWQCTNSAKTCSDTSGNNKEECDGIDNDCDGVPDGSENLTRPCGDTDVGECSYGTENCNDAGSWVNCNAIYPVDEVPGTPTCSDNKDNDCDGKKDSKDADCKIFKLTIKPSTSVTITSSPGSINCGQDNKICEEMYTKDQVVTLSHNCTGFFSTLIWSGDNDCDDGSITMDRNKTCAATCYRPF